MDRCLRSAVEVFDCTAVHDKRHLWAVERNADRTVAVPVVNFDRLVVVEEEDSRARTVNVAVDYHHHHIASCREDVDPGLEDDAHDGVDCDPVNDYDRSSFSVLLLSPSIDCDGVQFVLLSSDCAACALLFAKSIDHADVVLFLSILLTLFIVFLVIMM